MAHRSLTVGGVQVTAVCDVTGDCPAPLERAFPAVPPAAWAPWRRRHPEAFSGTDHWRLRERASRGGAPRVTLRRAMLKVPLGR